MSVLPSTAGSDRGKRSSLMAPTAGTDALAAMAQLVAAMAPPPPPADPLSVARGLAEAADLGAWLSTGELAAPVGMAPTTIRHWTSGHRIRPGFGVEKRKDGASIWWRVVAELKPKKGKQTHQ